MIWKTVPVPSYGIPNAIPLHTPPDRKLIRLTNHGPRVINCPANWTTRELCSLNG